MAQGTSFRDDFSGASVDTTVWAPSGSISETGGFVTLTGANGTCLMKTISPYLFTPGCIFECYANIPRTTLSGHSIGFANPGVGPCQAFFYNGWNISANIWINHAGNGGTDTLYDTGVSTSTTGTKHTFKIVWRATDNKMEYWIDGALKYTSGYAIDATYPMPAQLGNVYDSGVQMQVDYAFVQVPASGQRYYLIGNGATRRASNI